MEVNEIFVGNKPFMNYVRSAEILLRNKNLSLIKIRGRGKNAVRAIDLSEAIKNKFCEDLKLNTSKIAIGTEKFKKDEQEFSISVIEICLER
jgi:DNA-binding protein Alba